MRSPATDERIEELDIDLSDPFFFDHPLDHVPGTLLVSGLLDLMRKADNERSPAGITDRVRSRLRFTKICELDRPVFLGCVPEAAGSHRRWAVAVTQEDSQMCVGVIEFSTGDPGGRQAPVTGHPRVHAGAPMHLVHRRRSENVLIGAVSRLPGDVFEVPILVPSKEHFLTRAEPGFRTALEIVEAGRQFLIMLEHIARGQPADIQLLWLSVTTDIPRSVPRAVPLTLRWQFAENTGRRSSYGMSLVDPDTRTEHGRLDYEVTAMDRESYAKLRSA